MISIPSSIVSDDDPNFRLDGHATGLGRNADHSRHSRLAQLTWCDHSMICAGRKVQIANVVDVASGAILGIHLRLKPDDVVVVGALDQLAQQAGAAPL